MEKYSELKKNHFESTSLSKSVNIFSSVSDFVEKIPDSFKKIERSTQDTSPLLKQVIYSPEESTVFADDFLDPVGDKSFVQIKGILQKYHGRALLIVTGGCFGHCRYCFRRNFSYVEQVIHEKDLPDIILWFQRNPDVTEVILSGGDPLFVSNLKLQKIIDSLETVSTIQTIRVHTRVLSFSPQRIDKNLLSIFYTRKCKIVWVFHFNHKNEITDDVQIALQILKKIPDVVFLNQSVLLKGVNDTEESLISLSEKLFRVGILPYYLHQLDRVRGARHFEVSVEKGKLLLEGIRQKLPGYLVPKYVREIFGKKSKTSII